MNEKIKTIYENTALNKVPHIKRVTAYANILAEKKGISEKDKKLLKLAALLHDVGYSKITGKDKENKHAVHSSEMCEELLKEEGLSKEEILVVKNIILTHSTFDACKTELQKLLYDADKLDKTNVSEIIRKSIAIYGNERLNDEEIFLKLMNRINGIKFHHKEAEEIAEENKKPILEAFNNYKNFLDFANEINHFFSPNKNK